MYFFLIWCSCSSGRLSTYFRCHWSTRKDLFDDDFASPALHLFWIGSVVSSSQTYSCWSIRDYQGCRSVLVTFISSILNYPRSKLRIKHKVDMSTLRCTYPNTNTFRGAFARAFDSHTCLVHVLQGCWQPIGWTPFLMLLQLIAMAWMSRKFSRQQLQI